MTSEQYFEAKSMKEHSYKKEGAIGIKNPSDSRQSDNNFIAQDSDPDLEPQEDVNQRAARITSVLELNASQKAKDRDLVYQKLGQESANFFDIPESLQEGLAKRFILMKPLGSGGMGDVYEAFDSRLAMPVAVKVTKSPEQNMRIERFKREAKSIAKFASPYVVRIFDAGWSDEGAWYAMEKVEGDDLGAQIKKGKIATVADVVKVAQDVTKGLIDLDKSGIIHRDLKPGNILYREETDTYQLADFGLARSAETQHDEPQEDDNVESQKLSSRLTATGTVLGTPHYMAPEQIRGDTEISGKADVWALGIVLYELVAGQYPFKGEKQLDLLKNVLSQTPPQLHKLYDIPPALGELISGMLDKNPETRLSPQEVFTKLKSISGHENIPLRSTEKTETLVDLPEDENRTLTRINRF